MITAVFFDAVGTLFHTRRPVGEHYAEIAAEFGGQIDSMRAEAAFRATWNSAPALQTRQSRDGELTERQWWRGIVETVLDQLPANQTSGIDRAAYFDALFNSYRDADAWSLYPEVLEVLATVGDRGLARGIISNFDRRLLDILSGMEIRDEFDVIVHSGAVGFRKPHPAIFTEAVRNLGEVPGRCLHVGDDPVADWQGARAVGLKVFELDRRSANLRDLLAVIDSENR